MKKYINNYPIPHYKSSIFDIYFRDMKPAIFDIETTGLSFNNSYVVLVGLLIPTSNGVKVIQFFAESPDEEFIILKACLEFIRENEIDYLITFNGESFDIPFFNSRLNKNDIKEKLDLYNYDLYKVIRYCSGIPSLISPLTERNLELYMGIDGLRDDSIDGRESAKLYFEYIRTMDQSLYKLILNHNTHDLLQLYRLLNLNMYSDIHMAMYKFGIPIKSIATKIKSNISKNSLVINGKLIRCSNDLIAFPMLDQDLYINIDYLSSSLEVRVPLQVHCRSLYIDLSKYDIEPLLFDRLSIDNLDGYVSDYLILTNGSDKKYREINSLSILIMNLIKNKYQL